MTESANGGRGSSRTARTDFLDRLSHYDLVLAVVPVAFLVSAIVGYLFAVPPKTALVVASVVGLLAMLDALFLNPPTRPDGF